MSKMVSKYTASFDYFHKTLIISSASNGTISIPLFATVIGALAGIARASFSFAFWITADIVMSARSKLNSIGSKISKALMNNKINHEDFETIIKEE